MRKPRRIFRYGPLAVLLEWETIIDPAVNDAVHAYREALAGWPHVTDCVPAYASLMVVFDRPVREVDMDRLFELQMPDNWNTENIIHHLPVLYGGEGGPDLEDVAALTKLTKDEVINLHCGRDYRVFQLGFSPGFGFLGVTDHRLAVPRLSTPRASVTAGSVAIAGNQTAIYPRVSPGGWRIVGRCPLPMLNENVAHLGNLSRLAAGDTVRFTRVNDRKFTHLLQNPAAWKIR
ncbi:5-oxoprolinase subunit PxpB [Neolewinella antarctica]|uniref:Inhibitor of KinA n=1 Tax=Neolewinella antarctica TaxID=442734 RepID=A0ABX0XHY5_9BACT|nr:5-oxoprolinase subunit PxpB [Neolewinella antarctica]NJC28476.1 inhibitor of KinA [Neolewinella antarctica]